MCARTQAELEVDGYCCGLEEWPRCSAGAEVWCRRGKACMGTCWVAAALPSWCRNRWCIPDALLVWNRTNTTRRTQKKRVSMRALQCGLVEHGRRDLGELHESVVAGHGVRLRPAVVVMEKRARAVVLLLDGERGRAASPRGGKQRQLSGALALEATVRVVVGGVPVRVVAAPASVALPTQTTASNDG